MITESWCTKYTFFLCGAHSLLQAKTPINLHSGLFLKVLISAGSASQDTPLCSWGTPAKSCSMPPSSPLNAHPGAAPAPWAQCSVASIHVPGAAHLQVAGLWRETCQKLPGGLLQCWRPVRPSRGCVSLQTVWCYGSFCLGSEAALFSLFACFHGLQLRPLNKCVVIIDIVTANNRYPT